MPFPVLAAAAMGLSALGSVLTSRQTAKTATADRQQQGREFDQSLAQRRAEFEAEQQAKAAQAQMDRAKYLDTRAGQAVSLQDRLNFAPMADRAAALMAARIGVSPEPWQPRDYTQGTMPGAGRATGGVDAQMQAVAAANRGYRPGSGGINLDEIKAMLARLKDQNTMPAAYAVTPPTPGVGYGVGGGGGGAGGGARTPEEDMLMSRFTPYLG